MIGIGDTVLVLIDGKVRPATVQEVATDGSIVEALVAVRGGWLTVMPQGGLKSVGTLDRMREGETYLVRAAAPSGSP